MAVIQNTELNNRKYKILYRVIFALLCIQGVFMFFPLYLMITGSFKTNEELLGAVPTLWPKTWSIEGFKNAFSKFNVLGNIFNTIFFCGSIIIVQTFTSTLAAFSLSRIKNKVNSVLYMVILGTQMMTTMSLMFSTYILIVNWGMIGNKMAWVLMSSAWAYAILLYKNFFDSIPHELFEAAEIDGAGIGKQILHIMMPLSKSIFALNVLNTFNVVYNDYLLPVMIYPDEKDWTLMMRIFMMDKAGNTEPSMMYVLLTVTAFPAIVFYLFAQRHIKDGVTSGSVKG